MTSLTRARNVTRMFALGFGVAVVILIIGNALLKIVSNIGDQRARQIQITANVSFGSIKQPTLQPALVVMNTATLTLDLVNGSFPQASPTASVYKVATPTLSLSAQDRARARGTNLGFTGEPAKPNPTTFSWNDGLRTLQLNLTDQTFSLGTDASKISLANRQSFTNFSPLFQQATSFAQNQFTYTDLQYAVPQVQFVSPVGNSFLPQDDTAVIRTSFARISFLRQNINSLPVYSAKGQIGPINMIVIPAANGAKASPDSGFNLDQVIDIDDDYLPIDMTKSATYPIISADTAFQLLKSNLSKAMVSVEATDGTSTVKQLLGGRVLSAVLCYLEPDASNPTYFQPAWMFTGRGTTDVGDARWTAYIPAIDQTAMAKLLAK